MFRSAIEPELRKMNGNGLHTERLKVGAPGVWLPRGGVLGDSGLPPLVRSVVVPASVVGSRLLSKAAERHVNSGPGRSKRMHLSSCEATPEEARP